MPLKSDLLTFLSNMPKSDDDGWRKALGTITGVDRLIRQISSGKTAYTFFDELLDRLIFEGKSTLASFLDSIVSNDDFLGNESKNRLTILIQSIQSLTDEEWERELGRSSSNPKIKVPFVLPQLDVSTFTGREDQIHQLERLLLNPQSSKVCSIVGLSGGGGIGKSALAYHFATVHRDKFPDGVIGLRVDGKDVNTVAREFVRRCREELDAEDDRDATTLMQEVFARRKMLLIFDNAVDATVKKLRPGGNRCAVIITTRNRNLSSSLDISNDGAIDLNPLPEEDSLILLKKILKEDRVNAELSVAYDIIRLVGNLPLGLQIAGAALRGRSRSLADYAAALQQEKTRLSRLAIRDDDELNIEASLNLSLELLSEDEKSFFACLSVCAEEGFARRTACSVGDCIDEWEADDYLSRLYELSLLNYTETGQNRFVFHPLVRVYAKNLAQKRNVWSLAQERHAKFFVEWIQSVDEENDTIINEFATNLDGVMLAAEWLQTQESDSEQSKIATYQFALKLQPLFEKYGYWQKAITLMARFQSWAEYFQDWNSVVRYKMHQARYWSFIEAFDDAETILKSAQVDLQKIDDFDTRKRREAKVINVLAGVLQKQDKIEEAIQVFQTEILIEKEIKDNRSLAIVYNRLGGLFQQQGKLEEAQQAFQQSIEVSNDQSQIAIGLRCLGRLFQQQGKLEEAQKVFEQEILIDEALNDQSQLAISLNHLGGLLREQKKLEEAQQVFERQIEISETLNDQSQLVIGLNCLGGLLQQQEKLEEAQKVFEHQIEISKTLNDQSSLAISLHRLGGLLQQQEKLEEAQKVFERSIEISEAVNDRSSFLSGLHYLQVLFQKQGKFQEIEIYLQHKVAIAEKTNDQHKLVFWLKHLRSILQKLEKLEEASNTLLRILAIERELKNHEKISSTLTHLGDIALQQEKFDLSHQYFDQAITIAQEFSEKAVSSSLLNAIGIALHQHSDSLVKQRKHLNQATEILEKSQAVFESLNDRNQIACVLHTLGRTWKLNGDLEKSEILLKRSQDILEDEQDLVNLSKVLNTLGGVFEKQKKWSEAEKVLRQSYDLAYRLEDKRGQAITANSLGQVIAHQDKEESLKYSQMYFQQSIKLGEEIGDQYHLAKVYTAMGQALLARQLYESAIEALSKGFEIDISLSNIRGLKIVTPNLTNALMKSNKADKALEYCDRVLQIAPNNVVFLQLHDKTQKAIATGNQEILIKTGSVLYIRHNEKDKLRWGRITPDDRSSIITFNEKFIGSKTISKLTQGTLVEVELTERYGKFYASKIRIIKDEEQMAS